MTIINWSRQLGELWAGLPYKHLEIWLDEHGGVYVHDDNDDTSIYGGYIRFADPQDAVVFRLKYNL